MAIAGLLVHTLREDAPDIERQITGMPAMSSYGIHNDEFIVVVADVPSGQMEAEVDRIKEIDGVLSIYTTYVTLEDEVS